MHDNINESGKITNINNSSGTSWFGVHGNNNNVDSWVRPAGSCQ